MIVKYYAQGGNTFMKKRRILAICIAALLLAPCTPALGRSEEQEIILIDLGNKSINKAIANALHVNTTDPAMLNTELNTLLNTAASMGISLSQEDVDLIRQTQGLLSEMDANQAGESGMIAQIHLARYAHTPEQNPIAGVDSAEASKKPKTYPSKWIPSYTPLRDELASEHFDELNALPGNSGNATNFPGAANVVI